jgi:predicted RND superfamily exporter protein
MKKLKHFIRENIKRISWAVIFIFFLLFSGSVVYIAKKINFNYELDSFFPAGNTNLDFYLEHVKRFESDHDVVLVSITNKNGIFQKKFLERFKEACDSLQNMPEVVTVVGPLQMARMRYSEPTPIKQLFFHPSDESKYEKDSLRLVKTPHFVKSFVSFKENSVCFILKVQPELNIDSSKQFCANITSYLDSFKFDKVRLSGRVKAQTYIVSKMQYEFVMLAGITAVMLLLFLYFTFRNFWGVILPFLVVTIGMAFTLTAILFISGSLNLISVILPTVLFVVGVSDSVHVLNSYYTELNTGKTKIEAILLTVKEIGSATFLTAITSAVGFFTLITVNVKPIADFGVFSAIGIMIIYFVSFTFLIAMLVVLKPFYLPPQKEFIRHEPFKKLFYFVLKRRVVIGLVFIALLFPLVYGVFQIKVNNYFTEDFRKSDPHKVDFDFFDKNFGGVRPYELSVQVVNPKANIFDRKVVSELNKLEKFLIDSIHVGGVFSSNTLVKFANQMHSKGKDEAFVVSQNDSMHAVNVNLLKRFSYEFENKLVSKDLKYGRVTGRIQDIGAIEVRKLHAKLDDFYKQNIDSSIIKYKITGLSEIIDGNIRYLTANMMDGLIYELLAIGILMGLLFRSFKIMLLSLIPNVFPIVFIGGIMGLFGINLNVASSIIFSIAFGITVDDTIHLLARYKLELSKGLSGREALLNAYMYSGKAVAMTSVILFSGFSILMLSTFTGIFNTGMLVGITLIVAVLSDLFLLPILFGNKK